MLTPDDVAKMPQDERLRRLGAQALAATESRH